MSLRIRTAALQIGLMSALCWAPRAVATPCPNIMFVLDKSGSMSEDPNGGIGHPNKFELLQQAVVKTVKMYGAQVPFGMELFTSGAIDDQQCYDDTLPMPGTNWVELPNDISKYAATQAMIIKVVNMAMPDSGTNTGEAIKRAAADMALHNKARGEFIVLVTDGDPNCNGGDMMGTPDYTVMQIKAAAALNPPIHTFVIGFDGTKGVKPDSLNLMARAGKEPVPGCAGTKISPCYYSASNAQKFNDAINKIINMVVGGEFGTTMCDDSCRSAGCAMGYICTTDELNPMYHCAPDPCQGVKDQCQPDEYCRGGMCVPSCPYKCPPTQRCVDGSCVPDQCIGVSCEVGQACDPSSGTCVSNPCATTMCPAGLSCELLTGRCVGDPCHIVACPPGTSCVSGGNCEGAMPAPPDPNTGGDTPVARRGQGGCASVAGRHADVGAVSAAVLLCLALVARRRRR